MKADGLIDLFYFSIYLTSNNIITATYAPTEMVSTLAPRNAKLSKTVSFQQPPAVAV